MQAYDPKAKCPKCGHGKISSCHYEAGEGFYLNEPFRHKEERIDRACLRCHFDWSEAPIKNGNRARRRPTTPKAGETKRATVRKSRQSASGEIPVPATNPKWHGRKYIFPNDRKGI